MDRDAPPHQLRGSSLEGAPGASGSCRLVGIGQTVSIQVGIALLEDECVVSSFAESQHYNDTGVQPIIHDVFSTIVDSLPLVNFDTLFLIFCPAGRQM